MPRPRARPTPGYQSMPEGAPTRPATARSGGAAKGKDAARLKDKERARLRGQALGWLKADLAAWAQAAKGSPPPAPASPPAAGALAEGPRPRGPAGRGGAGEPPGPGARLLAQALGRR